MRSSGNRAGKAIARRNLIWSIVAENIGFSVWAIWSIVATKLNSVGFHYTTEQLFNLVALPGLVGALLRFPYTFAVTTFGGRNWTIFSASVLFIPTIALAYFVTQPDTPYWLMAWSRHWPVSAAAISPPAWRTSRSSIPIG